MVIDLDRCNGCQACEVACRQENNVAVGGPEAARENRTISWIKVRADVHGEWPHIEARFVPTPCMQCERPPCVRVCPTGATMIDDEGLVGQIYPRCIGCRYCANACPYTVKFFNWRTPSYPESTRPALNPDVSTRPAGVVEKCTFCQFTFGDLDDPRHRVTQLAQHPRAFRLLEELGTDPKVYYLEEER
jgi:molybdopterin-containing oxidoreductase family iron-sulfur binding subunit